MKTNPRIFMIKTLSLLFFAGTLYAGESITWGRSQSQGHYFDIYAGYGDMGTLEGRVQETAGGAVVSGGLDTSLVDLNIDSGSDVISLGAQLTGKWFTLLVDYRKNDLEASGTAETEIRLSVDDISFNGQTLDYLLIPAGTDYDVSADTTWLGLGLRLTPFTLNPAGKLRFTPWLHAGAQYIVSDFNIDAGSTVRVEVPGFGDRAYAVQGSASGEAQLIVPEYGGGAEFRIYFGEEEAPGPELALYGTYKILDYEGSLDDIGVEDDAFEDLKIDYTSLELGANLFWPAGERVDFLLGIYYEQVDSNTTLIAKPSEGNYQREVELNYAMYGLRAGLRF